MKTKIDYDKITKTPLTMEILEEAIWQMEEFDKNVRKNEMIQLAKQFFEILEKHKVKEVLFFKNEFEKDWKVIVSYPWE